MHNVDETLLVPKGEAGVCYGRKNSSETEGKIQTADKRVNNQSKIRFVAVNTRWCLELLMEPIEFEISVCSVGKVASWASILPRVPLNIIFPSG